MSLTVANVAAGYGKLEILQGVSLTARLGEIVGIIGPNGAGKSTLLRVIFGFLKPFSGMVRFGDADLTGLPPHQIVRRGIGYVAQARGLFAQMSVHENLVLGAYTLRDRGMIARAVERALAAFPALRARQHQAAGSLSGGEQRSLAIARALMTEPRLMLLDEPSAALAPRLVDEVYERISLLRGQGMGLLIVEQNVDIIMEVADRIYVLDVGRNAFDGSSAELRGLERIRRLYLGDG
jgi:ABC-type branched-subunit amino acid transport system ATPase component